MRTTMQNLMSSFQTLGRALMLPIAVLPAAGILLRLGQPDVLDIAFMAAAGQAIFDNIGLLFAVGVALGFAKGNDGAAGLAGVVCFLVTTFSIRMFIEIPDSLIADVPDSFRSITEQNYRDKIVSRLSTPIGIVTGLMSGLLFNRFGKIKLPEYLAFFGGRRFVPIVAAVSGMGLAVLIGISIEPINASIAGLSTGVTNSGGLGLFIYGVLNRLLLVTGLHHVLNNVAWFVVGDYHGATGDLSRFFAGDPDAGKFMSGFFPIMMFGLPAACLAMYRSVPRENRRNMAGFYGSMALTSFLTGVTEPVEFAFMFQAPLLYAIHALLTGSAMVVMDILNVKLGFGFSAGLLDYVINFKASTNPLLMIPVGLTYGVIYYLTFSTAIKWMGLKFFGANENSVSAKAPISSEDVPSRFIVAFGGARNIKSVSACTTRLRLEIIDQSLVNKPDLKGLGAKGIIQPSPQTLQVIMGPQADQISQDINSNIDQVKLTAIGQVDRNKSISLDKITNEAAKALGGRNNILSVKLVANRRLTVVLSARQINLDKSLDLPGCHHVLTSGSPDTILYFVIEDFDKAQRAFGDLTHLRDASSGEQHDFA